jgi:hypothetical protein
MKNRYMIIFESILSSVFDEGPSPSVGGTRYAGTGGGSGGVAAAVKVTVVGGVEVWAAASGGGTQWCACEASRLTMRRLLLLLLCLAFFAEPPTASARVRGSSAQRLLSTHRGCCGERELRRCLSGHSCRTVILSVHCFGVGAAVQEAAEGACCACRAEGWAAVWAHAANHGAAAATHGRGRAACGCGAKAARD